MKTETLKTGGEQGLFDFEQPSAIRLGKADAKRILGLLEEHCKQGSGCHVRILASLWTLESDSGAKATLDDLEVFSEPHKGLISAKDSEGKYIHTVSEISVVGKHRWAEGTIWVRYLTYFDNEPPKAYWWKWRDASKQASGQDA